MGCPLILLKLEFLLVTLLGFAGGGWLARFARLALRLALSLRRRSPAKLVVLDELPAWPWRITSIFLYCNILVILNMDHVCRSARY